MGKSNFTRNGQPDDDRTGPFDPTNLILAMAIGEAIGELESQLREVVEVVFDTMRQNRPLILAEIAGKLDIPYATFYDRLEKGLNMLALKLISMPEIQDWFPEAALSPPAPKSNKVARLLEETRQ